MSKDKNTKAFAQAKQHRRQWITFLRMCRYGVNNFTRNTWLTIAATAVMTLTLITVLITVAAQNILTDTATHIARNIDRSIYLKTGTTEKQAAPIINDLKKLSNIDSVSFISTDQGKADFAQKNKSDLKTLNALTEATDKIPATIRVNLKNANDTSQLVNFVKTDQPLKQYIDESTPPSFMGERKSATDTIAAWTRTAQEVGIGASIIFTAMSMLIIFNTIRMAIFNRRDEIEMMKLIGADKGFIRGPFVVEAMVYGFIAAVIATALTFAIMLSIHDKVAAWGVSIQPTMELYTTYIGLVLLGAIFVGALIGTISSLLATRRYLKI
jgi:cell division transport system permease protein